MYVYQILGSAALLLPGCVKLPCRRIIAFADLAEVQARRGTLADAAIADDAAQTGRKPIKAQTSLRLLGITAQAC